jgi:hypothetical protein
MQPQKQIEFRSLIIGYMKKLETMDARELIAGCEDLERWVENYVNEQVTIAVAPFIKIKISGNG